MLVIIFLLFVIHQLPDFFHGISRFSNEGGKNCGASMPRSGRQDRPRCPWRGQARSSLKMWTVPRAAQSTTECRMRVDWCCLKGMDLFILQCR